jgi:hypothetical protein
MVVGDVVSHVNEQSEILYYGAYGVCVLVEDV